MADLLEHRIRPAVGEPAGALVLFHGRGVDEQDLMPLLDVLDPERRLAGVCPRGPLSLPPGGMGELLDALPELVGVPIERTVLGGFSQGAVMAYAMSLAAGRPAPAAT